MIQTADGTRNSDHPLGGIPILDTYKPKMMVTMFVGAIVFLGTLLTARAADPSEGWLSYAIFKAPDSTDIITKLSASMTVPATPENHEGMNTNTEQYANDEKHENIHCTM